jgi:hypothetical protein
VLKTLIVGAWEGGFVVCFLLDVLIVYSLKLSFIANGNKPTGVGLALGENNCFGSLEFTTDRFGHLSLSSEGMTQELYS